ncbi:hypothetical protein AGABI1DRAFT_98908 [Agaricus bisporus var. burnettii JB137-S8]|uniref:Zn(2)-C6 fungal-type domain-containing protein n=1 Tax=Agaricus bisporus var. burnettii (strain JB137-S8 / ATCC MYA-4627 / FGSC 10392) TaxID=597362 RepID=K5XBV5_AGABU|nr:uncharacterized protein AGABI1DRAFT_98908 [Agaricus bisporus var. burnettii JB137-S8]EKM80783.1 hypothetical protein AGABI1DRAFT_98908 [Agaricus bisporus var. burnettii JB137-S8]
MEDSFQFIIESPQHNTGHKKRPRLVTSCDNCRLKKIKCLQPSPEAKCEACKAAKIPCRFKDRERYFAERSRAIAGPNTTTTYALDQRTHSRGSLDAFSSSGSSSPSLSSNTHLRSMSHSPKEPSGLVSPDIDSHRYSPYAESRRQSDYSRHSSISGYHSRNNSMGYNNIVGPGSADVLRQIHNTYPQQPVDSRYVQLFDPQHPQRPHPTLMPHFIQIFFDHYASEFTFLTYEETITKSWEQRLSPLLSNCIAAMAARYANIPELVVRGLHEVAETYCDNARNILNSVAHMPNMDTLHATMLLSWSEYKNERIPSFRHYCQMAMTMAMDLGLSEQNPPSHLPESERNRRRNTWACIIQLHLTSQAR